LGEEKKHWRLSLGSKVNNVDNEVEIDVNIVNTEIETGKMYFRRIKSLD